MFQLDLLLESKLGDVALLYRPFPVRQGTQDARPRLGHPAVVGPRTKTESNLRVAQLARPH